MPEIEMQGEVIESARTSHDCGYCAEEIVEGSRYYKWSGGYAGQFSELCLHPDCYEEWKAAGGGEFTHGEGKKSNVLWGDRFAA